MYTSKLKIKTSSSRPEMEIWWTFDLCNEEKHPKTSYDRQIIAIFQEIGVAESTMDSKV